jgi:ribosomal protein S18 acetylase RimI-like enzyme
MRTDDIADALALWRATPGMGLSGADEPQSLVSFIRANERHCWCAREDNRIIGTALCGSDGRRGYIYHLAVERAHQRRGVGRALIERVVRSLAEAGIQKCHAMVFAANEAGRGYWKRVGWDEREDLVVFSRDVHGDEARQ